MPVQYIRQRRNRRVSRNVPSYLREFVAQGQAQLKFQIIAHSVVVLLQAACRIAASPCGASQLRMWRADLAHTLAPFSRNHFITAFIKVAPQIQVLRSYGAESRAELCRRDNSGEFPTIGDRQVVGALQNGLRWRNLQTELQTNHAGQLGTEHNKADHWTAISELVHSLATARHTTA